MSSRLVSINADLSVPHIPVLLDAVMSALSPTSQKHIIDATFGAGGYSSAFLSLGSNVLAIDRDPSAIIHAESLIATYGDKFRLQEGRFSDLTDHCDTLVDGVVLDLGVSSMQLDESTRGFSFQQDGPLDMRMEQRGIRASDVVNHVGKSDLTRIIGILGDERRASAISSAIVTRRKENLFTTTSDLSKLVEHVIPRRSSDRIHPATKTFQALRIFVNGELDELSKALFAAERILQPEGCLCVVSFHSLEDKIVKKFFKHTSEQPSSSRHLPVAHERVLTFRQDVRGVHKPTESEISENPRARSAKLRYGIRTDSPYQESDMSIFGLPNLASLSSLKEHI